MDLHILIILALLIYFNIKMINRSLRKLEDPSSTGFDQGSARKFGNIVNRLDKSTHLPSSKRDGIDKYGGVQNLKPFNPYSQEESLANFEQRSFEIHAHQPVRKDYGMPQPEDNKKEVINRNRQFVAKVENINKIHDQINSLLKYVKTDNSKSLIKLKQNTHGGSAKEDEAIKNTPKQRLADQKFKLRKQAFIQNRFSIDTNIEENLISPVTQKEAIKRNDRDLDKSYHKKLQHDHQQTVKINFKQEKKNQAATYELPQRQNNVQLLSKTPSKINNFGQKVQKPEERRKLYDLKQTERASPCRIDQKQLTPKKTQRKDDLQKKVYCYNFQTGEEPEGLKHDLGLVEAKKQKMDRSGLNYDYQIEKVRERIQNSEQMTKRMEQKYLGSHKKTTNESSQALRDPVRGFQMEDSLMRGNDQPKNRWERKSYVVQTPKNFELQVYPCTIQKEQLRKDEVSRLIAEKLSEQIKLDQKLRDARQLFNESKVGDKWQCLQEKLKKLGYEFNQTELQNELSISSSESNPFSIDSTKVSNCVQELAETFAKSEQYWQKKLLKFISRRSIEKSGFDISEMDLDQRGYLSVEDLVCFVNLYTSNFFRNRDIICFFRRMTALGRNRNGIDYDNFLTIISHQ